MAATATVRSVGMLALLVLGGVGGALVTLWRLPVSARDTLHAEDGRVFLQDWLVRPNPGLLIEPYDGYRTSSRGRCRLWCRCCLFRSGLSS